MASCVAYVSRASSIGTTVNSYDCASDEADVFLDSRGSRGEGDIMKNALVSGRFEIARLAARANNVSNASCA